MKAGRITGALLIMYTGVALLLDFTQGTSYLLVLARWWPVLIVLLGLEYVIMAVVSMARKKKMGLDWGSVLFALLVAGAVVGVFHGQAFLDENELSIGEIVFPGESGEIFELPPQSVRMDDGTKAISIQNRNGNISIVSSDAEEMTMDATVIVPRHGREEAEHAAEAVDIDIAQGGELTIEVKTETYKAFGIPMRPKVNLRLTVPVSLSQELEAYTTNGNVAIEGVHITGGVFMKSTNGSLTARHVAGDVRAEVTNGAVELAHIDGAASATSTNGQVRMEEITGAVEAVSTNGRVDIRSSTVGGDWQASTTLGALSVHLPENGDFTLHGKVGAAGSIANELELEQEQREIRGRYGSGRYRIELETSVGALAIRKQPLSASP